MTPTNPNTPSNNSSAVMPVAAEEQRAPASSPRSARQTPRRIGFLFPPITLATISLTPTVAAVASTASANGNGCSGCTTPSVGARNNRFFFNSNNNTAAITAHYEEEEQEEGHEERFTSLLDIIDEALDITSDSLNSFTTSSLVPTTTATRRTTC